MKKTENVRAAARIIAILAALAAALALPAAAVAHPTIYTTQRNVATGSNPVTLSPDANLYMIRQHGYVKVVRESNGESNGAVAGSMLDFSKIPSGWRNQTAPNKPSFQDWVNQAGTGAQPHATCSGVPAIDENVILAWQTGDGDDPFYSYIPWQAESATIDDNPAAWIPVVQSATGVDLTGMDATQAQTACAGLGGTYRAADATQNTGVSISSAHIAEATAPLSAQISTLNTQVSDLGAQLSGLQGDLDEVTAQRDAALADAASQSDRADQAEANLTSLQAQMDNRPLAAMVAGGRISIGAPTVMVSGPFGASATVRVTAAVAKRPSISKGRLMLSGSASMGATGAGLANLKPTSTAVAAVRRAGGKVPVKVLVTTEAGNATTSATLLTR
jgi:outer membrane murein-binding lipoprotein Lpp